MKASLVKVVLAAMLLMLSVALTQEDEPVVDITALTIGQGTIPEYLQSLADPSVMCQDALEDEALADSSFTCLLAAIEAAGLTETLAGEGPFTVFAPTDEAFAAFIDELGVTSFEEAVADVERLRTILLYHVSPVGETLEELYLGAEVGNRDVPTLLETELQMEFPGATTDLETATVQVRDPAFPDRTAYVVGNTIDVDNGYIIPISQVLTPPVNE